MEFWNTSNSPCSPSLFFFLFIDRQSVQVSRHPADLWPAGHLDTMWAEQFCSERVPWKLFRIMGEAAWCFWCAVSPQHSTVQSAYLVFVFLMIASITLLYQRLFLLKSNKSLDVGRMFVLPCFCLYCECSLLHIKAKDKWVSAIWSCIA